MQKNLPETALSRRQRLARYVGPTLLSHLCFFMFTIIDGIFVGRGIGTDALGAVNIVLPFVMLLNALFMLSCVGGVTVVAIRLGRGDRAGANHAFLHSFWATIFVSLVLSFCGIFFTGQITSLLGANETFFGLTKDYLFWYSLFTVVFALNIVFQAFCRNDGEPKLVTLAVVIGTSLNVFGDWLFVFPLKMGLAGAAIATGISQAVSVAIVAPHFLRKRGALHFSKFRHQKGLFRKIFLRGSPEAISQFATPVSVICLNYVLLGFFGDVGVNAFSVIGYVSSFSAAVFFGIAGGVQPLIGQSYGARNEGDLRWYFYAGLVLGFAGSVLINVLLLFVAAPICSLFGLERATLDFTVRAMPQFAWGFCVMALNLLLSAYLYSTKRSQQAIVINILRSTVANTAVILLLPRIFGERLVWATFGIYELVILAVAVLLWRNSERGGVVFR